MISCDSEEKLFKHCAAGGDGSETWTAEILEEMLTCIRYRKCLANICGGGKSTLIFVDSQLKRCKEEYNWNCKHL